MKRLLSSWCFFSEINFLEVIIFLILLLCWQFSSASNIVLIFTVDIYIFIALWGRESIFGEIS